MDDPVLARALALLAYYAGVAVDALRPDSRPDNTPGWDSVANLSVLGALEEEFGVTFGTSDVLGFRTLGDIARFVAEHRAPA